MVVCNQWICGNADIFSIIHFAALLLHENRKAMAENFMSGRYYDFSRRFYIDNISCMADSNGIFDSRCWNLGNSGELSRMQNAKAGLDNDRNCSHCLLCSYGSYFYRSRETVEAIMNAAYPGKRIGVGGESGWENIVLWLGNLFYPMFGEGGIRETVVEDAGFLHCFQFVIYRHFY